MLGRYIQTREAGQPSTAALIFAVCVVNTVIVGAGILATGRFSATHARRLPAATHQRSKVALAYGMLCLGRMLSNSQSTRMTSALNVQMTAMLVPFVTAAAASVVLREHIEASLPPTLATTLVGCILILAGQGAFGGSVPPPTTSRRFSPIDAAGIAVQFISTLFSAAIKIFWRTTEGVLGKNELLISQFAVGALPTGCYCVLYDRASLLALVRMDAAGWVCFVVLCVGVYVLGNLLQMAATRALGAANATATHSVRLISATVGAWLLLGEPVESWLEWAGITTIISTITAFYLAQAHRQRVQAGVRVDGARDHAAVSMECAYDELKGVVGKGEVVRDTLDHLDPAVSTSLRPPCDPLDPMAPSNSSTRVGCCHSRIQYLDT